MDPEPVSTAEFMARIASETRAEIELDQRRAAAFERLALVPSDVQADILRMLEIVIDGCMAALEGKP